ncbi:unnamed protein product [Didymodactylos carnosus]|uniref:Uncharacterized protein n=1 Tax=Didymodactylos carnosus TaxID=1234261 RepID=A0A8S2GNU6_9BILA|nr:unnamed protein product [Didymodactylos carnosus]CAF3539618.1 unnamed protein product [Didymodactylos carnosus]
MSSRSPSIDSNPPLNNQKISTTSSPSSPTTTTESSFINDFFQRSLTLPQTKVGLGSTEGDLFVLVKRYLEIVGLVFFVWLLGYFHFSVSWILLIVLIYLLRQRQRNLFKQSQKMLQTINSDENEKNYIRASLDDLPSWVFFPDVERAEWVNKIIKQAWPYCKQFLRTQIFDQVVIPLVRGASPALNDFEFHELDLGDNPPRLGGIKVYTDNIRDQIMMDMEVLYAGDAVIKAKMKQIVCGVKNIQFCGDLRVIFSPLIHEIPLVGAVTYFFLRTPSIHFKLTDAGSLVDLPGLNDTMLAMINDIVRSMMVLPNRQVFPLVTHISVGHLTSSNPQGVVRVYILKARDLIKADINFMGRGKSDPFVKVTAGGNFEYKTKTINNTTDPEWNEVEQTESDHIRFDVFDEDPGKNDFIGIANFPVKSVVEQGTVETWLTLKEVKKGSIFVRFQYFSLTTSKAALEKMDDFNRNQLKEEKLSKALLVLYIDGCSNLPSSKKHRHSQEPNPWCEIIVDNFKDKTITLERSTNPKFNHISQILLTEPSHQLLQINVRDAKNNNDILAYVQFSIKQLYDQDTMCETRAFPLKSHTGPIEYCTVTLRLCLFILAPGQTNERISPPHSTPSGSQKSLSVSPTDSTHQSILTAGIVQKNINTDRTIPSQKPSELVSSSTQDSDLQQQPISPRSLVDGLKYKLQAPELYQKESSNSDLSSLMTNKTSIKLLSSDDDPENLIGVHDQNLPDPYVRLFLVPDHKKEKKKTKSVRDNLNPSYEESFEWNGSLNEIQTQKLQISIKNNSPLFAKEETYMGELQIDLSNLDPQRISHAWYSLQEPKTSAAAPITLKYQLSTQNNDLIDSNSFS